MSRAAIKVLAVLQDAEQTETEIAISSGLTLSETRRALDELLLTDSVQERKFDGLCFYSLGAER
jgi:hypothetical protein